MPQGMQVFDASGALVLDVTERALCIIGNHTFTDQSVLTVTDNRFLLGTPWFLRTSFISGFSNSARISISFSGNTMTAYIQQASGAPSTGSMSMLYGVY